MHDRETIHRLALESPTRRRLELAAVVAVSLVVSLVFCNKAFHVDDTLYLSIARQILVDPLKPFSGRINWQQITEPTWNVSISPPGFSYWLAGWMACGVTGEVGLHVASSFWLLVLGLSSYSWARRLGSCPVSVAMLVVCGPLVTAGQNLMLDVPMLALASSSIVLYFRACEENSAGWAAAAGLTAGLAVNVKYSAIVAIAVMGIDAIVSRRWRMLAAAATGLLLLAAGQLASWLVYSEPQLGYARRWITIRWPSGWPDVLHRTSTAVMYLGASAGWVVLVGDQLFRRSWRSLGVALAAVVGVAATIADLRALESNLSLAAMLHAGVFAFNGWLMVAWLLFSLIRYSLYVKNQREPSGSEATISAVAVNMPAARSVRKGVGFSRRRQLLMLFTWAGGFWYLGTLNGPFVAPRALLPCVLAAVLTFSALTPSAGDVAVFLRRAAVAVTLLAGLVVGAADFQWAGIYRDWAPRLAVKYRPQFGNLYFLGHWGWQHYAESAGMIPFDPSRTRLKPGDVLVVPTNVDLQMLPPAVASHCREVGRESVVASKWLPRTRDLDSFIFFHGDTRRGRIPWGWSEEDRPLDRFLVVEFADSALE